MKAAKICFFSDRGEATTLL